MPFSPFSGCGVHVDDRGIGHAAIGDPGFCPVDDVAVAPEHGLGGQRRGVRAGLRLGERVAADFFAAREGNQKFLLLFFRAEAVNRIAIQRILHRKDDAGGSAGARNFLDHDGVGNVIHPRAAVIFRDGHAGQAQFRGLAENFAGIAAGLVVFARVRLHFRLGKFPHGALQQLLIFGEFQVHGRDTEKDCGRLKPRYRPRGRPMRLLRIVQCKIIGPC